MTGKNWNSKKGIFEDIQKEETKDKAKFARNMRNSGHSVIEIAKKMNLSKSRIYQYFKD